MMLCYFISRKDYSVLDCVEAVSLDCAHDLDCGGKTTIVISRKPTAADGDFVIVKTENKIEFNGIVETIEKEAGAKSHVVSCLEIERCFDRQIFIEDTNIIKETGIEDFIAHTISKNFINSGDPFDDMPFINCAALTHTKVNSKPSGDNGIYNLKTYIGNIKEQYGIFIEFEFAKNRLNIAIHKKEQMPMHIDATITDVVSCDEIYKVNVLSKLNVLFKNTTTQAESKRCFYLHSDRTISEINEDRVAGNVDTIVIEAETEEEMIQAARNEFKSNSYSHSIEAEFLNKSKLYPVDELYVGHEVLIKTSAGIKESIISEVSFSDASETRFVKFGILKVTLSDKLK